MELNLLPLLDLSLTELTRVMNTTFEGYIMPVRFTAPSLAEILRADAIDLASSRLIRRDEETAGIALIARRGAECRLAAMALATEARWPGNGKWALDRL